jgi:RimJ/RimL family protein N-acetyltransferase
MRVYLRAFEPGDEESINRWRADPDVVRMTGGPVLHVSKARERQWVAEKSMDNTTSLHLAICLMTTNEMIGYLSVTHIDWQNKKAEGAWLVGRKDLWSKGYATEAVGLMLKHVFHEMGLRRFIVYCLEEHAASIAVAEKLGFSREGLLRQSVFKGGEFHNQVLLSILSEEYGAQEPSCEAGDSPDSGTAFSGDQV